MWKTYQLFSVPPKKGVGKVVQGNRVPFLRTRKEIPFEAPQRGMFIRVRKCHKGAFNNYVDKMRGGGGQKMSVFVHGQGIKTVHAGSKMAKFCPRSCWMPPKPKSSGYQWKKASLGVRSPRYVLCTLYSTRNKQATRQRLLRDVFNNCIHICKLGSFHSGHRILLVSQMK